MILVIGGQLSKYWKYIGQYLALQLVKSGIECVILAGSLLFAWFTAESCHFLCLCSSSARSARIFSRILTFWHSDFKKVAHPQGLGEASLSDLGPSSLNIGIFIGIDPISKYWGNILKNSTNP